MKLFNSTVLGILAILSLASCEMKNELTGNTSPKTEMGILELGISVKQPASQTRAGGVATNSFPVIITGASAEVADIKKEYATVEEMPSSVSLPVGKYTVTSHTPGKLEKKMSIPYYGGSTTMSITKGITTSTSVVCKMQNSRIQIKYGDDFQSSFQSWTITVDDGSSTALSFDDKDIAPSAIYWNFDESSVTAITVNIRAITTEGNTVSESRTFKKSDASDKYEDENEFFNGGDALDINMGTVSSSTGSVSGITIKTFITFENESESVEIPVGGEESGGGEEGGGEEKPEDTIIVTEPNGTNYLTAGVLVTNGEYPTNVELLMNVTNGIKNLYVQVNSDDETFSSLVDGMGLVADEGLDLTSQDAIDNGLEQLFILPTIGSTTYSFTLSEQMLSLLQSFSGVHKFNLKITDSTGNYLVKTLSVTVVND